MRNTRPHIMNLPLPLRVLAIAGLALVGLVVAAGLALLFGLILMWLWNWLMPAIFGLPAITFWQAWGLVLLCHVLFKSSPHYNHDHGHNDHWKRRIKDKLPPATPTDQNPESAEAVA